MGQDMKGARDSPQLADFLFENNVRIEPWLSQLGFPIYWVASNRAVDKYPHSLSGHMVQLYFSAHFGAKCSHVTCFSQEYEWKLFEAGRGAVKS